MKQTSIEETLQKLKKRQLNDYHSLTYIYHINVF